MTTEVSNLLGVNSQLKKELGFEFKSIFGGAHPTFFPQMIEEPSVDAICRGEAETAILFYLQYLNGKCPAQRVPNFWIKEGQDIVRNDMSPWPTHLDAIPYADRSLWDSMDPDPYVKSFFASRGCPYSCAYCFNHTYNELYGNPKPLIRRRSVDNFIDELKQVIGAYPHIYPFFDDDSFLTAPTSWLEEFKEKYVKEVNKPFGCNIRANQVTERKISLLAEAGCHHCYFGLECGDEDFANRVLLRNITNQQILSTAQILRKYNIRFATNVITALPVDDPINIDLRSLELTVQCKPDFANAFVYIPLPQTELARYAKEKGLFLNDYSGLYDPLSVSSALNFDPTLKRQLERQSKLFGVAAMLPFLKPFLPVLRKLPLLRLYIVLDLVYSGFCTRIKLMPGRKDFKYILSLYGLFVKKVKTAKPQ
jgi:radical SAM superfamily enzyme YgiQ (UPF0313 family)